MNTQESTRHARYAFDTIAFKRARDFYIYTNDGTRFIDLDMAEGRAVLGYKMAGIGARIKQNLDKGILHDIPNMWSRRFAKIISVLFPQHTYAGMYTRIPHAQREMIQSDVSCNVWKPFAGTWSDYLLRASKSLCLAPPLAWDPPLYALLLPSEREFAHSADMSAGLWVEDELAQTRTMLTPTPVSPVLYAAFCTALGLLHKCAKGGHDMAQSDDIPSYYNRAFPAEHKNKPNIYAITHSKSELQGIRAKSTMLNIPRGWTQRGIYISTTTTSDKAYQHMREMLWKWGFFMPQKLQCLITLPYFFTKRELRNWHAAIEEIT